jgi:hypothetical protein
MVDEMMAPWNDLVILAAERDNGQARIDATQAGDAVALQAAAID